MASSPRSNDDVQCDRCQLYFQKRSLNRHRKACLAPPAVDSFAFRPRPQTQNVAASPESRLLPTDSESPNHQSTDLEADILNSFVNDNDYDYSDEEQETEVVRAETCQPDEVEQLLQLKEGTTGKYLYAQAGTGDHVKFVNEESASELSGQVKAGLDLLRILKGRPTYLFREIQNWKYNCDTKWNCTYAPGDHPMTREHILKALEAKYGYKHIAPRETHITLPGSGVQTTLVTFSFGAMLSSLLTDPEAMQPKNLLVDWSAPYEAPELGPYGGVYKDIDTGLVYQNAWVRFCTKDRDILCPIILFGDKTHIDTNGKLTVEPYLFTLGIFKRSYRNQARAWRPLGYVPNIDRLTGRRVTPYQKSVDYHYCVRLIMSDLASHQKLEDGISWTFLGGDKTNYPCQLRIPVLFLIGDTEGHDKALAKKGGRNSGRICRYCNCEFDELGDFEADSSNRKLTMCSDIRRLRNKAKMGLTDAKKAAAIAELDELGYKDIHDGFAELTFADPERGLHGATPGEVLHACHLGMCMRCQESCLGMKVKSSNKPNAAPKKSSSKKKTKSAATKRPNPSSESEEPA